uniref:Podocin n=1 Tax=Callorhinchus milii TaxID=7868 RepID=A0A4W3JG91_CALMI
MTLAPVSNLCLIVESRSSVFFGQILLLMSYLVIIVTLPVSVWLCVKVIKEYERAVMFRLGRIIRGGLRGPGIFWFVPCIDTFKRVDLRTVAFSVATQEVLTKDSVTIMVDAVVFYRVVDPVVSVLSVVDANMATHLLAQTSLRTVLGTKNLTDILADREEMAEEMEKILYSASKDWGIKVQRVEFKDVKLPKMLQRAMAMEAKATRDTKALVISSQGELDASLALKTAAVIMSQSPSALQLRYLLTLSEITTKRKSTIIFPISFYVAGVGDKHYSTGLREL